MKQSLRKQLSPHFMLYEFTRSGVAIENDLDNTPNAQQTAAPKALCDNILEPLRLHLETKKAVPNFAAMKRKIIAKQMGNIRDVGAMVGYDFQAGIPMRIEAGLFNGSGRIFLRHVPHRPPRWSR